MLTSNRNLTPKFKLITKSLRKRKRITKELSKLLRKNSKKKRILSHQVNYHSTKKLKQIKIRLRKLPKNVHYKKDRSDQKVLIKKV